MIYKKIEFMFRNFLTYDISWTINGIISPNVFPKPVCKITDKAVDSWAWRLVTALKSFVCRLQTFLDSQNTESVLKADNAFDSIHEAIS